MKSTFDFINIKGYQIQILTFGPERIPQREITHSLESVYT